MCRNHQMAAKQTVLILELAQAHQSNLSCAPVKAFTRTHPIVAFSTIVPGTVANQSRNRAPPAPSSIRNSSRHPHAKQRTTQRLTAFRWIVPKPQYSSVMEQARNISPTVERLPTLLKQNRSGLYRCSNVLLKRPLMVHSAPTSAWRKGILQTLRARPRTINVTIRMECLLEGHWLVRTDVFSMTY